MTPKSKHKEESKRKISISNSGPKHHFYGKHLTAEHREKLRLAHAGKKLSEQHKHRISLGQKLHWKVRKQSK